MATTKGNTIPEEDKTRTEDGATQNTTKDNKPLIHAPPAHPHSSLPSWNPYSRRLCNRGLVRNPIWRVVCLVLMASTFIFLLIATMSTGWRVDQEDRYNVVITHGLWRACRDITFGATVDHLCSTSFTNDAPDWFQTVRAFFLMALLACFIGFAYSVIVFAKMEPIRNPKYPNITVSLMLPGFLFMIAAVFVLTGCSVYSVATAMDQALYFPENLPPTWGNSWAQVLAKRNTIPSDLPDVASMKMEYGYSFGLAWLSLFTTTATFVISFVASGE